MAPPTVEQTRTAASLITSLSPADFQRRKTQEVGDPLMAFLVILARKIFPHDPESVTVGRVQLMLASYFLRGELDGQAVTAPSEAAAKRATEAVAALSRADLDRRMGEELGDAVLTYFRVFSEKLMPDPSPDVLSKKVHLMVLASLLRGELTIPRPAASGERSPRSGG